MCDDTCQRNSHSLNMFFFFIEALMNLFLVSSWFRSILFKGAGGKRTQTLYSPLGAKAEHFKKCVKKAAGHIKRLGAENDRER